MFIARRIMLRYSNGFTLVVTMLLILQQTAMGFNSNEHERMGDRALQIALEMKGIDCGTVENQGDSQYIAACSLIPKQAQKVLTNNPTEVFDRESTYGFIDREVDFMLAPEELFVHIGDDIAYPRNASELNPSLIGLYAKRETEYLRSSHNNEAHFQGYALFNQFDWHRRARQLASERQNLYAALVANAISDHYLQDSFAPGHIITPRYNFEDEFALGMHDKYNKKGNAFTIDHWDELEPILEFIKHFSAKDESERQSMFGFKREAVLNLDEHHSEVWLQGDGFLGNRPEEELLITLVEVVSITEVLSCFQSPESCAASNRFSTYTWHPTTAAPGEVPAPPRAGIYFGTQNPSSYQLFEPVIGVSIGEDTVLIGNGQDRATLSIETVPFGLPGAPDLVRFPHKSGSIDSDKPYTSYWANLNIGPAFGWTYSIGSQYRVSGPTSRLIVAFPLEDIELSLYYRYLRYESSLQDHWSSSYGVRFDVGFSILKGYVALGGDHGYDSQGELKTAAMLSFGFELSGPVSRIPLLNKL